MQKGANCPRWGDVWKRERQGKRRCVGGGEGRGGCVCVERKNYWTIVIKGVIGYNNCRDVLGSILIFFLR